MRQGATPQSCTTRRDGTEKHGQEKLALQIPNQSASRLLKRWWRIRDSIVIASVSSFLQACAFLSQELYFARQIKRAACFSEFSSSSREVADFGSADKSALPMLHSKSEVETSHQGKHLSSGQAKGSDSPSAVDPGGLQHLGGQGPRARLPQLPPLCSAQPAQGQVSAIEQALTTTPSLRNLYPPILWLILASSLLLPALHRDSLVNLRRSHFQSSLPGFHYLLCCLWDNHLWGEPRRSAPPNPLPLLTCQHRTQLTQGSWPEFTSLACRE